MNERKILVVDDDPDIVKALSVRLQSQGYKTITAQDGLQAANLAVSERPDLIILDIGMPRGDGHFVSGSLRKIMKTCETPIIYLTASSEDQDYKKAYQNGIDKYITKPYDPDELLSAVNDLIGT